MSQDDSGAFMGGVVASVAVQALIGVETLGRLRGEAFDRYCCSRCGQPGSTRAEPASVIVERYRLRAVRVRFAHARCARSQVVEVAADAPEPAGLGGMLSKSAVLEYATEPRIRPLLILEPRSALSEATSGGKQIDLLQSGLTERGFTMLRTSAQMPAIADGWLLQFSTGSGRLLTPDDVVAYEGPVSQPRPWADMVRLGQACVVLAGTIGAGTWTSWRVTLRPGHRPVMGAQARGHRSPGSGVKSGGCQAWPAWVPDQLAASSLPGPPSGPDAHARSG